MTRSSRSSAASRRVTVKARGVQRQRTFPAGTSASTIADWKARERERILAACPPATKGTLAGDVDVYLDTLADRRILRKERTRQLAWWTARFGEKRRSDLTAAMIRAALAELRTTKAASTCNHYREALAAVWTTIDGRDARNPLRDVPKFTEPESEPRDLPHELVHAVLDQMPDLAGRVVKGEKRGRVSLTKIRLRVMFRTGLSPAEIMRIQPSDLFLEQRAVYVRRRQKGKGAEGMMLPLTTDGVSALVAFVNARAFGPFSTHAIRKSWVTACKHLRASDTISDEHKRILATARPYDLRHTFGTFVLRKTQNLKATQELMRHRSAKTTKRYVRAAVADHLRTAVEALEAGDGQPDTPQVVDSK